MRVVTWNCCRGAYGKKVSLLDALGADIAVIQECARPDVESGQCLWFGENNRQGIAILAKPPYRLAPLPQHSDVPKFMFPIRVDGPEQFSLLAVWSKANRPHPYIEGIVRGAEIYRELIAGTPTIVVGDFNSNAIWDSRHPVQRNHSALVDLLGKLGLVSCYHQFYNESHGAETRPTYFFQWKRDKPFHIDYCFAPVALAKTISCVEVGDFDQWHPHSDHRPLLVDFGRKA